MRWAENVGRMEEKWIRSLVVNLNRPLGKTKCSWEDNTKI